MPHICMRKNIESLMTIIQNMNLEKNSMVDMLTGRHVTKYEL